MAGITVPFHGKDITQAAAVCPNDGHDYIVFQVAPGNTVDLVEKIGDDLPTISRIMSMKGWSFQRAFLALSVVQDLSGQ